LFSNLVPDPRGWTLHQVQIADTVVVWRYLVGEYRWNYQYD
jgi:hypothetical protein